MYDDKPWWWINSTSVLILSKNGWHLVRTGGWHDIYCGRLHMWGSIDLFEALKRMG
jgi:hypothetical protein